MDRQEIVDYFKSLPRERQLRVLAIFAHNLTIAGRGSYRTGDAPPNRDLFMAVIEKLHRTCGQMIALTLHPHRGDPAECLFGLVSDDPYLAARCEDSLHEALARDAYWAEQEIEEDF